MRYTQKVCVIQYVMKNQLNLKSGQQVFMDKTELVEITVWFTTWIFHFENTGFETHGKKKKKKKKDQTTKKTKQPQKS